MLNLWKGFIRGKKPGRRPPHHTQKGPHRCGPFFDLCETFYLKTQHFVSHNRTNNANFS